MSNFPIQHLSVSSIRCFLSNERLFINRYINHLFKNSTSPAMIIWSSVHKWLEMYWRWIRDWQKYNKKDIKKFSVLAFNILYNNIEINALHSICDEISILTTDEPIELNSARDNTDLSLLYWKSINKISELKKYIENEEWLEYLNFRIKEKVDDVIDFWKTNSQEKCIETIELVIDNYFDDLPKYKPLEIEKLILAEIDNIAIPLKWMIDLLVRDDNWDLVIVDHKIVTNFTEYSPWFEIQAIVYFFLIERLYNEKPKRVIFDEVLKHKPKLVYWKDPTKKLLRADLMALCDENDIIYTKKNNIADFNAMLAKKGILVNSTTRKSYIVELDDPKLEKAFINLCSWIIARLEFILKKENYKPLPNPFDTYSWSDSWNDYKDDL